MADTFDITVTARPRNAILWRAAKKFGSQSALARALGVTPHDIGKWINLQWAPNPKNEQSPYHDPEAFAGFERRLYEATGAVFDDVFPPELIESFRKTGKRPARVIEITKSVPRQALLGDSTIERLTLPSPCDVVAQQEIQQIEVNALKKALAMLTLRQREIVKSRWGLFGSSPLTLEETGNLFGIGRERVRQIEATAMRKLERLLPLCGLPNASLSLEQTA